MNAFTLLKYVPMWMLYLLAHIASFIISLRHDKSIMKTLDTNLRLVYPELTESQRDQLARACIANQSKNMVESAKS